MAISRNQLILRGEKRDDSKDENASYYRRELSYGTFFRTITLAFEPESEEVKASFSNGVLDILIEKKPEEMVQTKKTSIIIEVP